MDLQFTAAQRAFRAEARAWLEANVPTNLPSGDTRHGFALHLLWEKKLFDAGWAVVSWPRAYGGRAASLVEWLIFEEEYYRVGGPQRVTQNGIFLLAPTIFEFGTDEQKQRILKPMAAGEYLWGQGWSEPGSGSDLASVRSKAERTEGGWLLSGQKTWCTRGAFCHGMYGLFRTDPEEARHRGLTYFMMDFDSPGVSVRGVERLDGDEGFAEVFCDSVFVPDTQVIGAVNDGWSVAMATTSSERGMSLRSPGRFMATANRLLELCGPTPRVAGLWAKAQAYRLYTYGMAAKMEAGVSVGAESSLSKLFWSELDVEMHEVAMMALGPAAEKFSEWNKGFQFALAGPIYAGTNEIQRNIVATRVLGLPRK